MCHKNAVYCRILAKCQKYKQSTIQEVNGPERPQSGIHAQNMVVRRDVAEAQLSDMPAFTWNWPMRSLDPRHKRQHTQSSMIIASFSFHCHVFQQNQ